LDLDGRLATARELLSRFPAGEVAGDAELAALAASDRRAAGSLHEAERYLALAERESESVPEQRRWHFQVALVLVRLSLARARNDLDAVAEAAQRALTLADSPHATQTGVGDESLRTTALIDLGAAEIWAGQLKAAQGHLEQALEEARRIDRPAVQLQALANSALLSEIGGQVIGERRQYGAGSWPRQTVGWSGPNSSCGASPNRRPR
jgi:LuxR family transcriptional regulator, maltose regulon positive regulatory protein